MIDLGETIRRIDAAPTSKPVYDIRRRDTVPEKRPSNLATPPTESDRRPSTTPPRDVVGDAPVQTKDREVQSAQQTPRDYVGVPRVKVRLNRSMTRLQRPIANVLRYFHNRPEVANGRSNWGMMHAMMVYGADTRVKVGSRQYSTIAWIAGNNVCRGQRIFEADDYGIAMRDGPGLQGHQGQLLAVFALCGVPEHYPVYVDGKKFSVDDIVRREMADCKSGNELTFTLIALSHYLDSDAVWRARDGERWSIERLIREEMDQPIVGAACGGTHRLMGFAHALRMRRLAGLPIDGQYAYAQKYIDDFVQYAYRLQNRDGSFSTTWFEGRQDNGKDDRKIQTTGHIVEWLLTVTPNDQLSDPRLVRAIAYLTNTLHKDPQHEWSIGPKGHALRSLAMFYRRAYDRGAPWQSTVIATRQGQTR